MNKILRRYVLSAQDLKMEFSGRILQTRCQIATASNKRGTLHRNSQVLVYFCKRALTRIKDIYCFRACDLRLQLRNFIAIKFYFDKVQILAKFCLRAKFCDEILSGILS